MASSLRMDIENLLNRRCSFCGNCEHNIRQCNSPLIITLDRKITEGYHLINQQGRLFHLNEDVIRDRFVNWTMNTFTLKELRVIAVTTMGSASSGRNKREYANDVWDIYKILTTRVLSSTEINTIMNNNFTVQIDINNISIASDMDIDINIDLNQNQNNSAASDAADISVTVSSLDTGNDADADTDTFDVISWTVDRTPTPTPIRHRDIEMMSLPNIRSTRANRIRERRTRDLYSYVPNPEFITLIRNLMNEDQTGDFIPFNNNNSNNKYNINVILAGESVDNNMDMDTGAGADMSCCICLNDEIKCVDIVKLNCQHQFCADCIVTTLKKHKKTDDFEPRCALCRTTMTHIEVNNADIFEKASEFCGGQ